MSTYPLNPVASQPGSPAEVIAAYNALLAQAEARAGGPIEWSPLCASGWGELRRAGRPLVQGHRPQGALERFVRGAL